MIRIQFACMLVFMATAVTGTAQSVWLPYQGELLVAPGFSYSTFDEFWVGRDRVHPLEDNDESLDQYTGYVTLEYGILERLAADATVGYTATSRTRTFGNDSDKGLADTMIGVRYRMVDEDKVIPAIAVRVGGIIAGTYDENTPFSAGDGAHGFESSILFGKSFGNTGFGAYGDIGYRVRENPVPDEIFGSGGFFKQFSNIFAEADAITTSIGYRHIQSLSGIDIMGRDWNPARGAAHGFPALREINQLLEGALGYTDMGGRQYQVAVGKSLKGRNTGDKWIFLFSVTLPFGGIL
jgi:hypothetical protein